MIRLDDGRAIPQLGFSEYLAPPRFTARAAVEAALANGYRRVDTAARHGNEGGVGVAIRGAG